MYSKSDIGGALGPIHYITIKIFYNEFDGWSYVVTEKPFFSSKIEFGSPDFLRDFFSTLPLHKAT